MKTKLKLSILGLMLLIISCKSWIREQMCTSHTYCPTVPLILEYFGNYKPGNYWIYENQEGTKRDSIYVSEYSTKETKSIESSKKDQSDCIKYDKIEFYLNSKYFEDKKIWAVIDKSNECNKNSFMITDSAIHSKPILVFVATILNDSFYNVNNIKNFQTHTNKAIVYPNGISPNEIGEYKYYLFAKDIGMVQFVTKDLVDTFSLIKHYIK